MIFLQNCIKNQKKLQYNSEIDDMNRVVVFTTEDNLENFRYFKTTVLDGGFKSAPLTLNSYLRCSVLYAISICL